MKEFFKIKSNIILLVFLILFLIPSIYFSGSYIYQLFNTDKVISKVTGLTSDTIIIEYKVNDKLYSYEVNNNDYTINDEIEVVYDVNDPSRLYFGNTIYIASLFIVIDSVFIILFLDKYNSFNKNIKRIKDLKSNGIYIEALIDQVIVDNKSLKKNNHYPYYIRCKYTNPKSKDVFYFDSVSIYKDVNSLIKINKIDKIPIFVNHDDYKNYYVDIECLLKEK